MGRTKEYNRLGFTLLELSITLVIIGLLIGGVLVGRDLINAAQTRAQISQIDKFNTAVRTFYGKYGGLPGDLNISLTSAFGFNAGSCSGQQGGRDGNGLLDGYTGAQHYSVICGETAMFWEDLSAAQLIGNAFPANGSASAAICGGGWWSDYKNHFPEAKIGGGNWVYAYEVNGENWYGVSAVTSIPNAYIASSANIPVITAYSLDVKMDDGVPTTGNVQAVYINNSQTATSAAPNAVSDSSSTCYNTTGPAYSTSINGGRGGNCALSFKFQ